VGRRPAHELDVHPQAGAPLPRRARRPVRGRGRHGRRQARRPLHVDDPQQGPQGTSIEFPFSSLFDSLALAEQRRHAAMCTVTFSNFSPLSSPSPSPFCRQRSRLQRSTSCTSPATPLRALDALHATGAALFRQVRLSRAVVVSSLVPRGERGSGSALTERSAPRRDEYAEIIRSQAVPG